MSGLQAFFRKRGKTVKDEGNGKAVKEINREKYSSYKKTNRNKSNIDLKNKSNQETWPVSYLQLIKLITL
jgi:hypothetical protein